MQRDERLNSAWNTRTPVWHVSGRTSARRKRFQTAVRTGKFGLIVMISGTSSQSARVSYYPIILVCPTRQCRHTSMILPRCTGRRVLPASTGKLVSGSLLRLVPPQAGGWVGRREAVSAPHLTADSAPPYRIAFAVHTSTSGTATQTAGHKAGSRQGSRLGLCAFVRLA